MLLTRAQHVEAWRLTAVVLVVVGLLGFVVLPLATVVTGSLQTPGTPGLSLDAYAATFGPGSRHWRALFNTAWIALAGTALAALFGTGLALLFARVKLPGARVLGVLVLLPLALPPIVGVLSFKLLLSAPFGWLHRLLLEAGVSVSLDGWAGVLAVHAYSLYVFYFLFVRAALARADDAPIEAARTLGASAWQAFWRVRWPTLRPAFAGATLLALMISVASFSAPFLYGPDRDLLVLNLYNAQRLDQAAQVRVLAVVMVLLSVGFIVWSRWLHRRGDVAQAVRGTPRPPASITRPGARMLAGTGAALVALLVLLPFVTIALFAFADTRAFHASDAALPPEYGLGNFRAIVAERGFLRPIGVSVRAAAWATGACLLFGLAAAWLMQSRRRALAASVEFGVMLPWALPATVVAVSLIETFNAPTPLTFGQRLVGTFAILPVAYFIRFLPLVSRAAHAALAAIDPAVPEAARTLGAPRWRVFTGVVLPLIWPGVVAGLLLTFVAALGEFVSSLMVYTARTMPMGVKIYQLYYETADIGPACAYALVLVAAIGLAVAVAGRAVNAELAGARGVVKRRS